MNLQNETKSSIFWNSIFPSSFSERKDSILFLTGSESRSKGPRKRSAATRRTRTQTPPVSQRNIFFFLIKNTFRPVWKKSLIDFSLSYNLSRRGFHMQAKTDFFSDQAETSDLRPWTPDTDIHLHGTQCSEASSYSLHRRLII